jgi:hypothetical protein
VVEEKKRFLYCDSPAHYGVRAHWSFRPLVHVMLENMWPRIMADDIQIEFSSDDPMHHRVLCHVACARNLGLDF